MKTERIFQIVTVLLIGVAAYFYWTGYTDGVFAAAVLASASFFLGIRFEMKERNDRRQEEARRESATSKGSD